MFLWACLLKILLTMLMMVKMRLPNAREPNEGPSACLRARSTDGDCSEPGKAPAGSLRRGREAEAAKHKSAKPGAERMQQGCQLLNCSEPGGAPAGSVCGEEGVVMRQPKCEDGKLRAERKLKCTQH